jgi:cysteine desulfurase
VLLAMGRDAEAARGGLRVSVGPSTTAADIDRLLDRLPALVVQARSGAAA